MYSNQTLDFVNSKKKEYCNFNKKIMNIKTALSLLDNYIDPSDPDLDVPNSTHAYMTAERIRKKYPNDKEYQLIGLIHDLGKVLFSFGEPSWAVVGDTYVLGCKFPKNIVFNEAITNSPEYGKYDELGIYQVKCGIENLTLSYGHDEYLYTVLKNNKNHKISDKYLKIIRYHSFYPWHTYNEYKQFMVDSDYDILKNVKEFNQFDLYSKEDNTNISNDIKEYYDNLLDEYFQGDLKW
tara:strand:- start:588 stop:1298 length:711 start_codon:yes stop_codon:yes gene_type:complete